jgi:predicted ester cyclase
MEHQERCQGRSAPSLLDVHHAIESIPNASSFGETAVTTDEAKSLANHWVEAWNTHDLDLIMTHYDDAVELTSPVAARLLGISEGKVIGKVGLRAYFQKGLEVYPDLQFRLEDVLCGINSVVLYYVNQKGTRTAEFMELSATGKVARVVANYST